jgi:hypothetical protein
MEVNTLPFCIESEITREERYWRKCEPPRRCVMPLAPKSRSDKSFHLAVWRAERPYDRRTAEQRDELAPPHSITSSARASRAAGMVAPIALAVVTLTRGCFRPSPRARTDFLTVSAFGKRAIPPRRAPPGSEPRSSRSFFGAGSPAGYGSRGSGPGFVSPASPCPAANSQAC